VRARGDVKDAANFAKALLARGGALGVASETLWTLGFAYKAAGEAELSLVGFGGLGFGVWSLGFGVWSLGFRVWGLEFGV